MRICIFGASGRELDKRYYDEADTLGELIGRNGDSIVFGGGAEGLMGACARGVHRTGGGIIGVAPRFFDEPGILYDKCSRMIFTETMRERKQLMQENSDACIVLPGGIGTLEEFFEILTLKQLGRDCRAIVLLNTLGAHDKMISMLEELAERRFMSKNCLSLYSVADTPQQAMEQLASYVPQIGSIRRLEDYNK
jgi:uncharacterized protein (TIGR00730 family)